MKTHTQYPPSILSDLKYDKIKINWNNNPIPMKLFLSFLNVEVVKSYDHLGSTNGWTKYYNSEIQLEIGGGLVNNEQWLDSIKYGKKKANPYNNYVNPFYLWEIMNDEGKRFFLEYYKEDIEEIITSKKENVQYLKDSYVKKQKELGKTIKELSQINKSL